MRNQLNAFSRWLIEWRVNGKLERCAEMATSHEGMIHKASWKIYLWVKKTLDLRYDDVTTV
jgi:hypothetical protein